MTESSKQDQRLGQHLVDTHGSGHKGAGARETGLQGFGGPVFGGQGVGEADIRIAIPKGRVLKTLMPLLERAGIDTTALRAEDRSLIRRDPTQGLSFLLLKPDDVPTYVEYGVVDLGIVGRDVLLEREDDLYAPVDLGIGRCRLVVAGPVAAPLQAPPHRALRIATKFSHVTGEYFGRLGIPIETIFVQGSVEIAPHTGLADLIVDLVESGETLRQNHLEEIETICDISSVVIANPAQLKLAQARLKPLLKRLQSAAESNK